MTSRRLVYPAEVVLVAALYFGAAKVGLLAAVAQKVVSSAWPPAGFALAVLVLLGPRFWPGVTLGAFLLNAASGVPVAGAMAIGVGNTLEAVAGALLLRRLAGFRPSLGRVQDVLALITLAAAVSTTLSATVGVASLRASGVIDSSAVGPLWFVWWSGDAMGVLVVASLLFTWSGAVGVWPRWSWPRVLEGAALLLAVVLLTDLVFRSSRTYVYAIFPVALWAALRFGPRGAATTTVVVAVLTVWYTLQGRGPFAQSTLTDGVARLQIFLALLSVTGLVLAAVTAERTTALQASRESEQRYQELLENAPEAILVHRDGHWIFANQAAARLLRAERPESLLGRPVVDVVHPDHHALVQERAARQPGAGDSAEMLEGKFVALDASVLDVEVAGMQITLDGRQARQIILREVGERKRADEALRERERQQAAVVQLGAKALSEPDLTALFDDATVLVASTLGIELCKVLELLPDGSALRLRAGVGWKAGLVGRAMVGSETASQAGYTLMSGSPVIVEDFARETRFSGPPLLRDHNVVSGMSVIIEGSDRPFGVLGAHTARRRAFTADDVHFLQAIAHVLAAAIQRKSAEEARRGSEERFRGILEAAPDAMVIADRDGCIVLVNRQTDSVFGYSQQELVGRPVESLMPDRFRESHPAHRAGYFHEPVRRPMGLGLELFALRKDGSEFPVDISLSPLETEEGTLVIATIRDITYRKQAETALRRSRAKLQALSHKLLEAQELERTRIARDLHDQVGQALTAVKLNVEALHRAALEPGHPAPFAETILTIERAIEDVRTLSVELRPALLDDLGLAAAVTAHAKHQAARAGGLELGLAISPIGQWVPKDVEIACFRALQEAITNVVRHSGARRLEIELRVAEGNLHTEVRDDGCGFDTQTLDSAAQPHQRLGMLGMQERAELVGGEITVESQPGAGTIVRARFPLERRTRRRSGSA